MHAKNTPAAHSSAVPAALSRKFLRPSLVTRAQEVLRQFREVDAGGRLVAAYTGSSPAAPEVLDFLKDALGVPIFEGYGSTETGPVRTHGCAPDPPACVDVSGFRA